MFQALMNVEKPSELVLQAIAALAPVNESSRDLIRNVQQAQVDVRLPDGLLLHFVDLMDDDHKPTRGWQHLYPLFKNAIVEPTIHSWVGQGTATADVISS